MSSIFPLFTKLPLPLETSNVPKETRKRKTQLPPFNPSNQLTQYFSSALDVKSDNDSKENYEEPQKQRKRKTKETTVPIDANACQKITIFLKKDQNTISVSTQVTEELSTQESTTVKPKKSKGKAASSQGILMFKKSPAKVAPPVKVPKKTMVDFNCSLEEVYNEGAFTIFGKLLEALNEDLKKKFNVKKVERLFHTSMKQFLRSSPDQLWSSVYRPIAPHEVDLSYK